MQRLIAFWAATDHPRGIVIDAPRGNALLLRLARRELLGLSPYHFEEFLIAKGLGGNTEGHQRTIHVVPDVV